MNRPGPLVTLLTGLVLGVVLLTLNATTGSETASGNPPGATGPSTAPTTDQSAPPPGQKSPAATPSPSAPADADYAGRTDDGAATVALNVQNGKVTAYVCDGRTTEAWLKGTAQGGDTTLTGDDGATMTVHLAKGKATGKVRVGDHGWTFTAPSATRPAGLYRAEATVRGAVVAATWIVLQNGQQVGVLTRDGRPSAAPALDLDSRTATVDGEKVTAEPVDGSTGEEGTE